MKSSFTGIEWQDYLVIAAYFGSVLAVGLYVSHISYAIGQRHTLQFYKVNWQISRGRESPIIYKVSQH